MIHLDQALVNHPDESVNLARVLALCACGFNERARQALIALLPGPLAATVTAASRQGDDLLTSATGPIENDLPPQMWGQVIAVFNVEWV
jgi:hypothetical protein